MREREVKEKKERKIINRFDDDDDDGCARFISRLASAIRRVPDSHYRCVELLHAVLRVYAADGVDRIFVSHGTVGYVRCDGRGDL